MSNARLLLIHDGLTGDELRATGLRQVLHLFLEFGEHGLVVVIQNGLEPAAFVRSFQLRIAVDRYFQNLVGGHVQPKSLCEHVLPMAVSLTRAATPAGSGSGRRFGGSNGRNVCASTRAEKRSGHQQRDHYAGGATSKLPFTYTLHLDGLRPDEPWRSGTMPVLAAFSA
jgi:hypothetical protein